MIYCAQALVFATCVVSLLTSACTITGTVTSHSEGRKTQPDPPAKSHEDDNALRIRVAKEVYACGIRDRDIDKYGVAYSGITRADVVKQQSRVDSVRKWAAGLTDDQLKSTYNEVLDGVQDRIDSANNELANGTIRMEMSRYDKALSKSREMKIAVPPCGHDMPLGVTAPGREQ